jgi:hypothetical protein
MQFCKFIDLGHELTYFVKHTKGKKCYTQHEVISMLEFLIDNILVEYIWQKIIGIHMGTQCERKSEVSFVIIVC